MVRYSVKLFLVAVMVLSLFSCAKERYESKKETQERILDSYLAINYPNAERTESGIAILSYNEGSIGNAAEKYAAVYANYSLRSLSGTYTESTDPEIAKKMGSYSKSTYYGPKLFELGYGSTFIGLEEIFIGMKKGGKATFILPPWLTTYSANNDSWNSSVSAIYDIEVTDVITNMIEYEELKMRIFMENNYPAAADTISKGFYFTKLYDAGAKDTVTSANVYYIGRLLNGFVFDTNIADSAKKFGIYDSSKEYTPLSVSYSEDLSAMKDNNSLVEGFCKALQMMKYGDKGFTLFSSSLGYSDQSSGQVGPFQPLSFWLYVEENKD